MEHRVISNAIRKSLEEKAAIQEEVLDAAYEAANQDSNRVETIREWEALDDISDLIDENEDWNWLRDLTIDSKE